MRAVQQNAYGLDAIEIVDHVVPEPGEGRVRVRVEKASMNPADWHFAIGRPLFMRLIAGLRRPKHALIGSDFAGVIDALGPEVTGFEIGDKVFGSGIGAFSEFADAKAERVARTPASMTAAEAAGLPIAGVTAFQALEDLEVAGKRVVVNGASGGVGHYAVQIALAQGAAHVAGVCSTKNLDLVAGLGAEAIDYTTDDFTAGSYDILLDCVGSRPFGEVKSCLNPGGHWVLIGAGRGGPLLGPVPALIANIVKSKFSDFKVKNVMAEETSERLAALAKLVDEGKLRTHIEREYPLAEIRAAYDHSESKRSRGKVIIAVA